MSRALSGVALLAAAALGLYATAAGARAESVIRLKAEARAERPALDASFILPTDHPDVAGFYAIRLGELFRTPGMEKVAELYAGMAQTLMGDKKPSFGLNDVEQVCGRITVSHDPKKPAPNRALMLSLVSVRMEKDFDWAKQLKEWTTDWTEHAHAGATYYSGKLTAPGLGYKDATVWFYLPDGRTVVVEDEASIKKLIDRRGKPASAPWADDWKAVERGMIALVLPDVKGKLAKKVPDEKSDDKMKAAVVTAISDISAKASRAVIGFNMADGIDLQLLLTCEKPDDVPDVHESCAVIMNACRKLLEAESEEPETDLDRLGRKLSDEMLESTAITSRVGGDQVGVRVSTKGGIRQLLEAFSAATGGK
jgi:hypothetical protein